MQAHHFNKMRFSLFCVVIYKSSIHFKKPSEFLQMTSLLKLTDRI